MSQRKALITGITGQDGAYLARLLVDRGYSVLGTYRARAGYEPDYWRLRELGVFEQVQFVSMGLTCYEEIRRIFSEYRPDEVYNFAAQSFISQSLENPLYTAEVDAMGVARLLEAARTILPEVRFFQASSAEIFGRKSTQPQNESTPFCPANPYAAAKSYAQMLTANYRECFGLYSCSGILFNHESSLRGPQFVTRKICAGLAQTLVGDGRPVTLGNIHARRDWGFAGDYVRAMWLMLQQEQPEDFVLATGRTQSVKDFAEAAARALGLNLIWKGEAGCESAALDEKSGKIYIEVSSSEFRPRDSDCTQGDPRKARERLGWTASVSFDELVGEMALTELKRARGEFSAHSLGGI